jgi:transcriptional regulator of aromatic amino acid metabolism
MNKPLQDACQAFDLKKSNEINALNDCPVPLPCSFGSLFRSSADRRLPFLAVAVPLLLGSIGSANGLQKRMRGAGAGWRVLCRDLDALVARVAPKALALLAEQPFPGNVRELRNLLERTTLMCDGERIEAEHVAQSLSSGRRSPW